jgi:hypothetical protein
LQCCGSKLIYFGFESTNFFFGFGMWIQILRLIFWPQFFQNGASNCFHMCSGTCMSEEKNFPIEKHNIFLFQVFDLQFFTRFFILTTVSGFESELFLLRIRIQPKLSDSFGFGSTTLSIWFRFDLAFFIRSTSLEQLCQFAVQFFSCSINKFLQAW